jgi:hypothetical protein
LPGSARRPRAGSKAGAAAGARGDAARMTGEPTFERLLAEGGSVPLAGWDFSWFEGRATEERPRWAYAQRFLIEARKPR